MANSTENYAPKIKPLKTSESLNKIVQMVNENEHTLWRNRAYAKYFKIEYDKLVSETKIINEQITRAEFHRKNLENDISFAKRVKEETLSSKETYAQIILQLVQRKSDAEKDLQVWKDRCSCAYIKYYNIYMEQRKEFEKRCPLWNDLHLAIVEMKTRDIQMKILKQRVVEAKQQCNIIKQIRRKIFNSEIVNFVIAVKDYYTGKKLAAELEQADNRVRKLLKEYEESIRSRGNKLLEARKIDIPALFSSIQPMQVPEIQLSNFLLSHQNIEKLPTSKNDNDLTKTNDAIVLGKLMKRCNERKKLLQKLSSCDNIITEDVKDIKQAKPKEKPNKRELDYGATRNQKRPLTEEIKQRTVQEIKKRPHIRTERKPAKKVTFKVNNDKPKSPKTDIEQTPSSKQIIQCSPSDAIVDSQLDSAVLSVPEQNFIFGHNQISFRKTNESNNMFNKDIQQELHDDTLPDVSFSFEDEADTKLYSENEELPSTEAVPKFSINFGSSKAPAKMFGFF